ncbi:MAG: cob(I)yrinic acid a,c-diamide adenosyltransferase [archaeon]|nr:cob(I)yrinic acid a,c-diamide adenosyltransferase [archaeon]MCP8314131.1 cob(I)yrinic acid a,c-diamide adenosyltransferase [archaeon]
MGKTTSAIGLGLRAIGHGLKVYMIQFMKREWEGKKYGEIKSIKKFRNFKVAQFGSGELVSHGTPNKTDFDLAKKGFEHAKEVINSGKYDIVILDEIWVAVHHKLIDLSEVISLIKSKPKHIELVLTGRYAPEEAYDYADYVSEIKKIKHPYSKGLKARLGIEY